MATSQNERLPRSTNTYFETPWDDNEWECIRTARQLGISAVEVAKLGIVDPDALRMRGLSKERRNDMPLISIALIVDSEGIPVDFRVYAGNKSEKTEMMESIKRLREVHGIKKCVVVADRGLNTVENLIGLENEDLLFMVAQSIAQLPEEVRKEICRSEGWTGDENDTVRYKEIQLTKKFGETERTWRLVVSLSPKRLARDLAEIELAWEEAQKAVSEGRKLEGKKPAWAKFVKFTRKGQKGKDKPKEAYCVNTAAYKKALSVAGLYGIVTNIPNRTDENPLGMTAAEIFQKQRELLQIEDCFRVMKDALELRPVNVRNKRRIRGHVMLCVVALTVLRLLAKKLKEAGTPMSIMEISDYLNWATLRSGGKLGSMTFRPAKIKLAQNRSPNLRFKDDDKKDAVSLIMKAAGLRPIYRECDRFILGKCLGTWFETDEDVLGCEKPPRDKIQGTLRAC